jgi:hypothetical protein
MIILHCMKMSGKLRIKFHTYINHENIRFTNVYSTAYNCMFPKDIRQEGKMYRVPDTDIRLANRANGRPFYSIKRSNIHVMTDEEIRQFLAPIPSLQSRPAKIFDAGECVICLSSPSTIAFIPCGHRCVCSACNMSLKQSIYRCPVCRESIKECIME